MRSANKPSNTVKEVFKTCIKGTRDARLKTRLSNTIPQLVHSQGEFNSKAKQNKLDSIKQLKAFTSGATPAEIINVYTSRMVKSNSPGRNYYDKILLLAPGGLCPYCSEGRATTLDHYLDKAAYPQFSVTPLNLVPACKDCNHNKAAYSKPHLNAFEIINPYYDRFDEDSWLKATIIKSTNPVVEYSISLPASWSTKLKTKVERHFEIMDLKETYGIHAASILCSLKKTISKLHAAGGPKKVKLYLEDLAESHEDSHLNSCQTALYRGAANSGWYCSGGFNLF